MLSAASPCEEQQSSRSEKFREKLAQIMNVETDNVDIFSVTVLSVTFVSYGTVVVVLGQQFEGWESGRGWRSVGTPITSCTRGGPSSKVVTCIVS